MNFFFSPALIQTKSWFSSSSFNNEHSSYVRVFLLMVKIKDLSTCIWDTPILILDTLKYTQWVKVPFWTTCFNILAIALD